MRAWPLPVYNNNHIKLMAFHIGLTAFYLILLYVAFDAAFTDNKGSVALAAVWCACFVILHLSLAYGSLFRLELSRKASELVGGLLLLGFPIGTIAGYFFLQYTLWQQPEDAQ